MKEQFSPSAFARRARETKHDALGLSRDLDASIALAALARRNFVATPSSETLNLWQALLQEVVTSHAASEEALESANAFDRWVAREVVRLNEGQRHVGAALQHDEYAKYLTPEERESDARTFRALLVSAKGLERQG